MRLGFCDAYLARLCNREAELIAWVGDEAAALQQLLNELDSADTLGQVEKLPHVLLVPAPAGRVATRGADEAGILLKPETARTKSFRDAKAGLVIAVAVGVEEVNPEGAAWPRASGMSRTTQ